jgi:hypothetical protein
MTGCLHRDYTLLSSALLLGLGSEIYEIQTCYDAMARTYQTHRLERAGCGHVIAGFL